MSTFKELRKIADINEAQEIVRVRELLEESASELLKKKDFGLKALMFRYEELRKVAIDRGKIIEDMPKNRHVRFPF